MLCQEMHWANRPGNNIAFARAIFSYHVIDASDYLWYTVSRLVACLDEMQIYNVCHGVDFLIIGATFKLPLIQAVGLARLSVINRGLAILYDSSS